MSTEIPVSPQVKNAEVLALEIIGERSHNAAHDEIETLVRVIDQTDAFRGADIAGKVRRLILPNDVVLLIFTSTPDAPARCAIQIGKALRSRPTLRVRMGIHRGEVGDLEDSDHVSKVLPSGLEQAIRIMQCGDAGHILVTREMAGRLRMYGHLQKCLNHFGEFKVDGHLISVLNLFTGEAGREEMPEKLSILPGTDIPPAADRPQKTAKPLAIIVGVCLVMAAAAFLIPKLVHKHPLADAKASVPEKSIAVLPFENITGKAETGSFAEGIQDEILTQLAKLSDLKVISRTSVLEYKKAGPRNVREIGQQLGVAYVLEGSVQEASDHLRVTAQLIDARTDAHVWAQTYDRVASDILGLQTEIAQAMTEQLKVQMSPRERESLAQAGTNDLVAERLLREGAQRLSVGSNPDAKQAFLDTIPLIEEALQRDPKYMRAYSFLVAAHLDLYWQGFDHTNARVEAARDALQRAIAADPNSGETHFAQGLFYYRVFRDYDRARAELEIARRTLPNSPGIHVILGAMDRRQGRWSEAIQNLNRAIELDPRNFRFLVEAAFTQQVLRHYDEVTSLYNRALDLQPRDGFARTQLASVALIENGDVDPLRNTIRDIVRDDPGAATGIAGAIFNYALATRNPEAATRALQAIRAEGLRDDYNNSLWSRDWFVGLAAHTFGHEDEARAAFESARQTELKNVQEQPEYAPAWSRLGLIEAMLGHKEDAIKAAQKACELIPTTVDAVDGASYRTNLALTYLWTGDRASALSQLGELAKMPGGPHYGELRLYPQWDALRGDPTFEKIVTSLAPANSATAAK